MITGEIRAPIKIECKGSDIPAAAFAKLEKYLQENYRSQKNLNDLIGRLREDVADWEDKYKGALSQNLIDSDKNPDDPLLEAERIALEAGELEQVAEIREDYFEKLEQETVQAAYITGERWETAFKMKKALKFYRKAVQYKPDYLVAWWDISRISERLGNNQLALEALQNLQKYLDPEEDKEWFSIALSDEADVLVALGKNAGALTKHQKSKKLIAELLDAEPDSSHWQRELSVSHNKVGDMQLKSGDNVAALKAYEDGLAIAKQLAELDPNIVGWQTDLVVSYYKLAQLQPEKQKTLLSDALAILKKLHSENKLGHEKQGWIPILEQALE